jgi:hypothetical protein
MSKRTRNNIQSIESTLSTCSALEASATDLVSLTDPLFSYLSSSFDEGKVRGLLTKNLSCFEACNLQFTSQGRPSVLVGLQEAKKVGAGLNLVWVARHMQQLCEIAEQEFRPSLRDQAVSSKEDDELMSLTLGCIEDAATATAAIAGVLPPHHGSP